MTSLGGIEVLVDAWGADAVYSGSQKCLSCIPGISPVTFSPRAVERIRELDDKIQLAEARPNANKSGEAVVVSGAEGGDEGGA